MKKLLLSALAAIFMVSAAPANAGQDVLLTSTARTATTNVSDITRGINKAAHVVIVVTAVPGTDTITPRIQGKDALGNYYDILVGAAISTTGTTVLKVGQGVGVIATGSAADFIPDMYRVVITHSAGSSFTYSVTQNTSN